ncbi:zinc ribbon domain-containing protein [Singulisphaera rosea]
MKISFECPSCAASGSVDAVHAGKRVRCRHCKYQFAVPGPEGAEPLGYSLEEAPQSPAVALAPGLTEAPVFVPARGDEVTAASTPRRPRTKNRTNSKSRPDRGERRGFAWAKQRGIPVLITIGVVLLGTALFVPGGVLIAGYALLGLGTLMAIVGFGVGAFGAFSEDFIHGFFYVVFPPYAAFYFVTRWDDLWIWFAFVVGGVGLITLGGQLLEWAGVAV